MRLIVWLLRTAVFFTLFAFALNNQHEAAVHWFFGHEWRAPMVFIVLAAFAFGCAFGVVAMVPRWWRGRRTPPSALATDAAADMPPEAASPEAITEHPPRDGL